MANTFYKQFIKRIKAYQTIVIARHIGPDPDAIASEIALRDILRYNFPDKKIFAVGTSVSRFKYLGTLDKVEEEDLEHSLLIILDVPKFDRVDGMKRLELYDYTIKIDHHPTDEVVCDLEWVDETSSSTCQMITELVYNTKLKMTKEIAEKLYVGIISDSDRFLLFYTTPKTLELSAKLLNDYKFELTSLYEKLYIRGINERKLEAYIINHITITENGFAYIKITEDMIKEFGVDAATPSNMVNDLNFIKEIKVWAFSSYDEKNKLFKINIRSRSIIINEIAAQFNGGGHKLASGARLKTQEEVDALFKALDQACANEK